DDPQYTHMLGRCLIDKNPSEALKYLGQACSENRSVDYLFDLARCHQLAGDDERSIQLHWEILEQNPYCSASWTNLFLFGRWDAKLWPFVAPMLSHGCGVDDEYFHVAVVKLARSLRERVPVDWFSLAMRRREVLQTYPGFGD